MESNHNTEFTQALYNPTIGASVKERQQRFKDVKKVSRILNIGGIVIFFWLLVYPHPSLLSFGAALLYPIIAMAYFFRQQEVLTLMNAERKSIYPSLNSALISPPGALLIRAIVQYDLFNFKDCLLPIFLSSAAFTLIFLLFIREPKVKSNNFWMGVIFSLIYSCGGVVIVNCAFDESKPTEYKARVLDQYTITSKSTTYYLKLAAWGPRKDSEAESVPRTVYNQVKKGEFVSVHVKKGLLLIPWYYVQ